MPTPKRREHFQDDPQTRLIRFAIRFVPARAERVYSLKKRIHIRTWLPPLSLWIAPIVLEPRGPPIEEIRPQQCRWTLRLQPADGRACIHRFSSNSKPLAPTANSITINVTAVVIGTLCELMPFIIR